MSPTPSLLPGKYVDNYNPPTELWEGNVFTRVCLSVFVYLRGVPYVTITRYALYLTVQPSSPPPSDI